MLCILRIIDSNLSLSCCTRSMLCSFSLSSIRFFSSTCFGVSSVPCTENKERKMYPNFSFQVLHLLGRAARLWWWLRGFLYRHGLCITSCELRWLWAWASCRLSPAMSLRCTQLSPRTRIRRCPTAAHTGGASFSLQGVNSTDGSDARCQLACGASLRGYHGGG